MDKYDWTKLSPLQLGRYAEYYAKMEFTLLGFDVYEPEVDDKGIDFIIRKSEDNFYEIQVKSLLKSNYAYVVKEKFSLRKSLYLALVLFKQGSLPELYLIPSLDWQNPNELLVGRDYIEKKSKPEWGVNITKKSLSRLQKYQFERIAETL